MVVGTVTPAGVYCRMKRRNQLVANGAGESVTLDGNNASTFDIVPESARRLPRVRLLWAVATTLSVTALVLVTLPAARGFFNSRGDEPSFRFAIPPPEQTTFGTASLSPDGRQLAFTASSYDGQSVLWVRPLDMLVARPLPETDGAAFPFWSPSSDQLGFFAAGELWTIDLAGGSPRPVADAPNGRGGTWNRDGIIVFAPDSEGGLFRVPATGGTPAPVTTVARPDQRGHVWPEFLPGGHHFVFLADAYENDLERYQLLVGALDAGPPQRLLSVASSASYADGYLLFVRDRALIGQPFDPARLALTGEPVTIADDRVLEQSAFSHRADFSVSATGNLVYRSGQSPATRLVWHDRMRPVSTLVDVPAEHQEPTLSHDESRVAIDIFDPKPSPRFGFGVVHVRSDIWILDRSTGRRSQFTTDPAADWGPVWSPDDRTIVFSSERRGKLELFHKDTTDPAASELPLPSTGPNPIAQSWSPDGKFVLYAAFDPKTRGDLWLLPMTGDRIAEPLLQTEFSEVQGQISPDGKWFAYTSDESGRKEVYVQSFPKPAAKRRISTNGGGDPRWRRDGRELFYISPRRQLMAVPVTAGATFEHGLAVALFETRVPPHWYNARNLYDVSRDGRFLFMAPVEDDRSIPLTVVLNWKAGVAGEQSVIVIPARRAS